MSLLCCTGFQGNGGDPAPHHHYVRVEPKSDGGLPGPCLEGVRVEVTLCVFNHYRDTVLTESSVLPDMCRPLQELQNSGIH